MNYFQRNTFHAMHTQASAATASVQRRFTWPTAAALVLTLGACASGGPAAPQPKPSAAVVTHNCKPQETVGFSCELRDHRLLSLCASPDFLQFKGKPMDNPGYAYLAVGTQDGAVQYSHPSDPKAYKRHFFIGYPTNGIPYLFVTSTKGQFFYMGDQDDTNPQGAGRLSPENQPDGWNVDQQGATSTCLRVLNFDHFRDLRMPFAADWSKERARLEAEQAKGKQP